MREKTTWCIIFGILVLLWILTAVTALAQDDFVLVDERYDLVGAQPHFQPPLGYTGTLYFTASFCGVCKDVVRDEFPRLVAQGWRIGGLRDHIRVVDADREPHLVERYRITSYPTFIRVVADIEESRVVGRQTANEISNFANGVKPTKMSGDWETVDNERSSLIAHLRDFHNYDSAWLDSQSTSYLHSLTDFVHRDRTVRGQKTVRSFFQGLFQ